MAKISELRELDEKGLENKLKELETDIFELKFQVALSKLENVALIRTKRRDIAKVRTLLREKELAQKVEK